jgi:VIT1/CCC1 family predicted Fe2+/Mn2+ transporter
MSKESTLHRRASILRDAVFAASDGLVTTFAVVAGSTGATLSAEVVLILGFANLFADGFSLSAGTYLGVKSEMEFEKAKGDKHISESSPFGQALVTFLAFDLAGFISLVPYVLTMGRSFLFSLLSVLSSLFIIGMLRSLFTGRNWFRSGVEMLLVGGFAAIVAYGTGFFLEDFVLRR